jgi:hypothetical protein
MPSGLQRARDAAKVTEVPLSERQAKCLATLSDMSLPWGEYCLSFRVIEIDAGMNRIDVKRSVRALARKGFAEFHNGLTTEDGSFAGAGYCITPAGLARDAIAREPTPDQGGA